LAIVSPQDNREKVFPISSSSTALLTSDFTPEMIMALGQPMTTEAKMVTVLGPSARRDRRKILKTTPVRTRVMSWGRATRMMRGRRKRTARPRHA